MPDRLKTWSIRANRLSLIQHVFMPSLHAIREGLLWLIPCLILSSLLLFIASITEFITGERSDWVDLLYVIHSSIAAYFPFLMSASIGYVLALQWKLPRPPIALLCVLYLSVVSSLLESGAGLQTYLIVMAITIPLYAVPTLSVLTQVSYLRVTRTDSAGQIVKESLNLVIPALLTLLFVIAVNLVVINGILDRLSWLPMVTFDYANEPTLFGATFAALNSTLWFFGIHGYYALLPLVDLLQEASNLNLSTVLAGGNASNLMNLSLMGTFVFIGGSGATLSLVIALLLFSEHRTHRLMALASIPIGLINVNEILLFGLPIILNPRLFLPFLIAPMVNVVVSVVAVSLNVVPIPTVAVPFNSPIIINALMSTEGNFSAVGLQLFNIMLGVFIYLPAVRGLNKALKKTSIQMKSLDTTYTRRQEEVRYQLDDPVLESKTKLRDATILESRLDMLSRIEFCLEYQPQVDPSTGKTKGCEALIRAKNSEGAVLYPGDFIPWLDKGGLMKDMDLWVCRQVVKDIKTLELSGIYLTVSINVTANLLTDDSYFERMLKIIEPVGDRIHLEIVEESMLNDEKKIALALNKLHQIGSQVHIDDFGTGFSSLSYLNQFDIDAVKVDRSFVLALSNERGVKVFNGILSVANELELKVIVEGVESQEQLDSVPRDGSVLVQGWLYSKSLPLEKLIAFVNR